MVVYLQAVQDCLICGGVVLQAVHDCLIRGGGVLQAVQDCLIRGGVVLQAAQDCLIRGGVFTDSPGLSDPWWCCVTGSPGLSDPCEKEQTDVTDSLTSQQKEELTASAQVTVCLFGILTAYVSHVSRFMYKIRLSVQALRIASSVPALTSMTS